jgi:hypothetical protein
MNALPGTRCSAAHPDDPTPCDGPPVVTVLDRDNAGADGREWHAARLWPTRAAGVPAGLTLPVPDRRVQGRWRYRPFAWLTDAQRSQFRNRGWDEEARR